MYDQHAAEGTTLGSHEHAEPRHKFSPSAVQRVHSVWVQHVPPRHIPHVIVKILRHQIGQKWGNSIPCNGGGWVDIDHILSRESAFPQDRYKKSGRFQMIAECIRSEDRKARKPRLQILAAKFDQVIDIETMEGLIDGRRTTLTGFVVSMADGGNHGAFVRHQGIRISDLLVLLNFATSCFRACPSAWAEHFT